MKDPDRETRIATHHAWEQYLNESEANKPLTSITEVADLLRGFRFGGKQFFPEDRIDFMVPVIEQLSTIKDFELIDIVSVEGATEISSRYLLVPETEDRRKIRVLFHPKRRP